ncbi:MAG TPA: ELWxxDGT repeat protein, partial [Pirellulales bacterium]
GSAASATFTLDVTTTAFPPLLPAGPPGSQVSHGTLTGAVNFVGDTDSYTLSLAAGQTLSIALLPSAGLLLGQISLRGPGVSDLALSPGAGIAALLESVAIGSSGTYTITVTGLAADTGAYTLEAVLNAAFEDESLGIDSDDSQLVAQSLDGGFRSLAGAATEAAVVGSLSSSNDQDWYRFTLAAGQSVSLDVLAANGASGLELRDASGNLIASGAALGTVAAVNDFVATTGGIYYARIFGNAAQDYSLLITENADFDLGQGATLATALPINSAVQDGQQLISGQLGPKLLEGFESNSLAAYTPLIPAADSATLVSTAAHDGQLGLSTGADTEWIYRADPAAQVEQGATLSVWVRFDGSATGRAYFGFGASAAGTLSLVVGGNTDQLLLQDNTGYGFITLAAVSQTFQAGTFYRLQVNWGVGGTIVGQLYASDGTTLLNSLTATDNAITSGGIAFRGFGNNFDFDSVTVSANATNFYQVQMAAGAVLGATTSTPGDSGGLPGNNLDPQLQIFNAAGSLVASDDNSAPDHRNAMLSYTVPAGGAGTYYVAVSPSPLTTTATAGTYVLALTGTLVNHAPVLNASVTMTLPTLAEDPSTNAGALVSAMLASGAGGSPISDADPDAVQGIAVTGVDDSNGTWQYSFDNGNSWTALDAPSPASALLLPADDLTRIRFVPDQYYVGRPASSITFRAWDQTSGVAGGVADASVGGNSTAFSAAVGTATITITEVNHPPVLLSGAMTNLEVVKGSGPVSLALVGLTFGPGGGANEQSQTLAYTVTAVPNSVSGSILIPGNPTPLVAGQVITLAQLQSLEFVEAANDPGLRGTFSFNVTDNGTTGGQPDPKTLGESLTISILVRPETQMLADINPGSGGSSPKYFTVDNQAIFFSADDGTHGVELWETDGTTAGTVLVMDISTGAATRNSNPRWLTVMNGKVYFEAFDPVDGYELYVSDGTAAGTLLVKDIAPGAAAGAPTDIVNLNGELIFQAQDPTNGVQLWESDGTAAGTVLLKDINPGGNADPTNLTVVNNTVFFQADDATHGVELWKTDGTTAGTVLVKDIEPGGIGSYPSSMVSLNGTLFFATGNVQPQIWKSDGTAAGTVPLTDSAGITIDSASDLRVANGEVYFMAAAGNGGFALWKTDGTTAGTEIVDDVDPTAAFPWPANLVNVNGTLFFTANDGTHGPQLWASDGTTAGTVMLTNVAGANGLQAENLTNVDGQLLFSGTDGANGVELWRSDGTVSGTEMIADINPGSGGSYPEYFAAIDGTLYFSADDGTHGTELWTYSHLPPTSTGLPNLEVAEGAGPSTVSLFPAFSDPVDASPSLNYTIVGDTNSSLFAANPIDPVTGTLTLDYQANRFGTASITVQATDSAGQSVQTTFTVVVDNENHAPVLNNRVGLVLPTIGEDPSSNPGGSVPDLLATGALGHPIGDADYGSPQGMAIVAADNSNGAWQFSVNGGAAWTAVGALSSTHSLLLASSAADLLRFVPNANYNGSPTVMLRAWDQSSGNDGTYADTTVTGGSSSFSIAAVSATQTIYAVNDPPVLAAGSLDPLSVVLGSGVTSLGLAGVLYGPGGGPEEASQTLTYTITAVPDPAQGTVVRSGNTTPLTLGTVLTLADLQGLRFSANPADTVGGHSTFSFDVTDNGTTDGQPDPLTLGQNLLIAVNLRSPLALVDDLDPGTDSSNPGNLTNFNGTLFFTASNGMLGDELWKSDGTAAGTTLVKDIDPGPGSSTPEYLTVVGDTLFFVANDGTHGTELWKTDGTTAGTVLVDDINPGSGNSYPSQLTNVNGTLFFTANDGTHGTELWKSDGTAAGTSMVMDIDPGSGTSAPSDLTSLNGILYFAANDGTHGSELWRSDGTTAGTYMVRDIDSGAASSLPGNFAAFDGLLYFSANDGTHGSELWKTDGTLAGTTLVIDLNPGGVGGYPSELAVAGG